MWCAQHARPESISKRARSTTPPSLRFRINDLRAVSNRIAQNLPSRISDSACHVVPIVYQHATRDKHRNCVRPPNLQRSLTATCEPHRYKTSGTKRRPAESEPEARSLPGERLHVDGSVGERLSVLSVV